MEGEPMRTFMYFALFEHGEDHGIVVSFPDVPEAITQGDDEADAYAQAEEALGLALLTYPARGLPLPRAKAHRGEGLVPVAVEAEVAAKLAVIEAVRASGITKSEFARRIGKDEKEARRILDPKHPTKLTTVTAALRELGQRLVIGVEPVAHRSVA
jgi:antitoxin HicB